MTRRAFTLLEALIALAMVAMLAGSVMSFLWTLAGRTRALREVAAREDGASLFLDRLESDLLSGLAGGRGLGAGVQGDASGLKIMTRGVGLALGPRGGTPAGDVQLGEYRFEEGAGRIVARRWTEGGATPELEAVASKVRSARFRYHDGLAWQESFDSAALNSLPAAVEVALWFGEAAPAEQEEAAPEPTEPPPPDRVRLIVIPDGPATPMREVL